MTKILKKEDMTDDTQPEKFDLRSLDVAAEQQEKLRQLFPEVFTEGGKVDFDRLKSTLGEIVDSGKERYGINWPGKTECYRTIQAPSRATLRPCRDDSANFDTTGNIFIEGDNLEALKLLQKGYLGKVKMIYIDPPYNTGNEFIYPDSYSESLETYLEYTGQVDSEGRKFSTNTEAEGRFHSKWINMMYPRLFLARNLLSDDGLIFISIDDHEVNNLRKICDEVFGEENFKGQIARATGTPTGQGTSRLVNELDYIVVYSRVSSTGFVGQPLSEEDEKIYDQQDNQGRYLTRPLRKTGGEDRREDRPSMYFAVKAPDGTDVFPIGPGGYESRWRCGLDTYQENLATGFIEWKKVKDEGKEIWKPYQKFYLEGRLKQPSNLWTELEGNKKASREVRDLFGEKVFDFPKPLDLIRECCRIACPNGGLVMDFFAGSGTTGHAVMLQNADDRKDRQFILVQLPESLDGEVKAQSAAAAYCDKLGKPRNIAELTKERLRRAGREITERNPLFKGDCGFRAFKLDTSNFKPWNGTQPEAVEGIAKQLELHVDHVLPGRSQEDILTELLLKSGFALSTKVEATELAGKQVFSVEDGAMLVCLDTNLTSEVIKAMADKKPSRVICLDDGFQGNDQLKTNAVQTMKARGVLSFRTV